MNNINSEDVDVNVCKPTWPLSCGDSMFIQPDARFTSHQSSIFTVQKRTIGLFIPVSNTHEHEETRASVSIYTHTHTVHSMTSRSTRQSTPTDIRPTDRTGSSGLSSELLSASLPKRQQSHLWRSRTHIHDHEHTHIKTDTKDRTPALESL